MHVQGLQFGRFCHMRKNGYCFIQYCVVYLCVTEHAIVIENKLSFIHMYYSQA